ncbi:hypothetical protein ACFXGR_34085 [Streptomyces mirabilis]|uniref:hypothetical protein n=1 Tax=Streptomyces mirabilis TaxID=68239 RepID=UPI003677B6DB
MHAAAARLGLVGALDLEALAVQVEHGPVVPGHPLHQGALGARYVSLGTDTAAALVIRLHT